MRGWPSRYSTKYHTGPLLIIEFNKQEVATTLDALAKYAIEKIRKEYHKNTWTYNLTEISKGTIVYSMWWYPKVKNELLNLLHLPWKNRIGTTHGKPLWIFEATCTTFEWASLTHLLRYQQVRWVWEREALQQVQTAMKNYFPLGPVNWVDLMTLKMPLANKDVIWRLWQIRESQETQFLEQIYVSPADT